MKPTVFRSLKDIQVQAQRLQSQQNVEEEEIEHFFSYSNELRSYLLSNVDSDIILERVKDLPTEIPKSTSVKKGVLLTLLGIFGISANRALKLKEIQDALNVIRDISGRYGTIEFMIKNAYS